MKRFFKGRISLRLHIFLAFLIVLSITFTIILSMFNVMSRNYIEAAARESISNTFQTIKESLDRQNRLWGLVNFQDPKDFFLQNVIRPSIQANTDRSVSLVLTDLELNCLWPDESYSDIIISPESDAQIAETLIAYLEENQEFLPSGESRIYKLNEKPVYFTGSVIHNRSGSFVCYLFITYDVSGYTEFFDQINNILLTIIAGTLVLAVIIALFVSQGIISSIQSLGRFAEGIGRGRFKQKDIYSIDKEIDRLGANMNEMAAQLDQASHEQQIFFQNVSHELRTPLMSIQGYAEGLKYAVFDDPLSASEVIISESERLTGMVENLLSISRMDMASTGRQQIPKTVFDIRELVGSVVEKVNGIAIPGGIRFEIDFPEEEMNVLGNENDIFRAIENILSNGLRYAKESIHIRITAAENRTAEVRISDDGPGISDTLLPHLFERFAKGDEGKHGIGLALVKAIVTEHNGTVTGGNRTDAGGAVFVVQLPMAV